MPNQLEDDVQRVLDMARSQSLSCRPRSKPRRDKRVNAAQETTDRSRYLARHRHDVERPRHARPTLVAAKMQGLAAVYALDRTTRHLADRSANSVLRHQMDAANNNEVLADDPEVHKRKLDSRRELYKLHYSGSGLATATCASTGLTKLESLTEAAQQATKLASRHLAVRIGAAVLTSRHRILSACAVESMSNDKYSVCAEHAAILKMLTTRSSDDEKFLSEDVEVVEAVAICSDREDGALPYPCGGCREYMASFGDFPVYLLNSGGESNETRSFELFPGGRHVEITKITKKAASSDSRVQQQRNPVPPAGGRDSLVPVDTSNELPLDVSEWTIEHVARWVVEDVELPQYRDIFLRNRVDGCVLSHLEDCDLQLLLGIVHPLHRKRLLVHLDRLRDRELLVHGIDYGQLQDYLAVLDRDRIAVVARLKATFDRLDVNQDGFLDFEQVHAALKTLGSELASPQAVEQLLRNEKLFGSDVKDGKVTFPAFATAFSSLAMQPASEKKRAGLAGRNKDDNDATLSTFRLPIVDLPALRGSFNKVDINGSGHIDEKELVQLFQSLGHDRSIAVEKAHEWFNAVDVDGDARLSFAEFLLRYLQLSKIDVRKLRTLFEASEPLSSTRLKPRTVVRRSLATLFSNVDTMQIDAWSENFFSTGTNSSNGSEKESLTVSFADFVLACLSFNSEVAEHNQQGMTKEMALTLRNDALVHRSRIVHLQQQGHVRLCPQSRELQELRREHVEAHLQQLERVRKQQDERSKVRQETEREGKSADSDEEETEAQSARQLRDREIDGVFDRFAKRRRDDQAEKESKSKDSDDEYDQQSTATLTVVQAAQAALELGAALSREQLVRFLQSLGFDLRHPLSRRDFHRAMAHLDAKERVGGGRVDGSAAWKFECSVSTRESGKRPSRGRQLCSSGKQLSLNRKEYDERLLARHDRTKDKSESKEERKQLLRDRSSWSQEMRRAVKGDRPRRSRRRHDDEAKGESSASSDDQRSRSRRCKTRRHHHRDSSDDSNRASSTSSDRSRRRHHRSSSRGCTHRRRGRSPSSNSDSTDSMDSRPGNESPSNNFRVAHSGFSEGDRIRHKPSDTLGTILRVYRDYFVADVLFDSGRRVKNVDLASLQRVPISSARPEQQWKRGLAVLVPNNRSMKTGRTMRRGKIIRCRTDGTFDVLVDEFGESETVTRIPATFLRPARRKQPAFYGVGAKVTVRQRSEYLRGTVSVCRTDGSYDVRLRGSTRTLSKVAPELLSLDDDEDYDDDERQGDVEGETKWSQTRSDSEDEGPKRKTLAQTDSTGDTRAARKKEEEEDWNDNFEPEFDKGDRIEARFHGGSAFFPGKIARVYTDDTYDVEYDDGDEETRVPSHFIRSAKPQASTAKSAAATSSSSKPAKRDDYDDDLFESD